MNKKYKDISYLRRYIDGELSAKEMYDLERMAHQNEMLVDILLGLEYEKSHRLPDNLPELQRRIRARVRPVAIGKPWPWTKWAIAASFFIAVLGATFYLTKDRLEKNSTDQLSG
jgi:hypothetical protein